MIKVSPSSIKLELVNKVNLKSSSELPALLRAGRHLGRFTDNNLITIFQYKNNSLHFNKSNLMHITVRDTHAVYITAKLM